MSSPHKSSSGSNNGRNPSSIPQKKPSFLVRFIKGTFFQIFVFFTTIILLGVGYAAWTTLDRNDAADGKPVTQTLMQGIVDNINDLGARVTTLEVGQTTGGTVTGPLRWSSEYSGQNYEQAWSTCLALSPAGAWRIPSENEVELGRHLNTGLFTGTKNYWSSAPDDGNKTYTPGTWTWNPSGDSWYGCTKLSKLNCTYNDGGLNSDPMIFRCVSDA